MYKFITIGIIAYLCLISLSAQTKYWDNFREPSGRLTATYLSKDEIKSDRIERRFYTKWGLKLLDAQLLSLASPHEIIGRLYFWPNGEVSQEIMYDTTGIKRKSVHYWGEDGTALGAEQYLSDSSGYNRVLTEYPDGGRKFRTNTHYQSFRIQKVGWYPNGKAWFEVASHKGDISNLVVYDSVGQALDLSLLSEEKINWEIGPDIQNREEILKSIGYPQIARAEGIQGKLIFRLLVSPTGKVMSYHLVQSPGDILTIAVEQYLWDLAFIPAQSKAGVATYGYVDFVTDFKLLR